ncbi:hypothetical protein JXM67_14035 [candidate division WOR-3 bacterium]|nr:hypothetical protein [candidate division WOR-3 bacterium]
MTESSIRKDELFEKFVSKVISEDLKLKCLFVKLTRQISLTKHDLHTLNQQIGAFKDVIFDYICEVDFRKYGTAFYYETPTE